MGGPPQPPPPVIPVASVTEAKASFDASNERLEATVDRVSAISAEEQDRRINDEWSAVESIRHIVFVIDIWLSKTIRGQTDPFHPIGIPPHFVPRKLPGSSIDPDTTPSFDEARDALRDRLATLRGFLDGLVPDELTRPIDAHAKTVGGALNVIFTELNAHNRFINRDLDIIEAERRGT
ncbi:MAG: DinB family protein [Actinomycetota bacterium]